MTMTLETPSSTISKSTTGNSHFSSSSASKAKTGRVETPLDLELDLKAQQTKLTLLQDEIDRLKEIKATMEQAKAKGIKEMPAWLQEHENFQQMLLKVSIKTLSLTVTHFRCFEKDT